MSMESYINAKSADDSQVRRWRKWTRQRLDITENDAADSLFAAR